MSIPNEFPETEFPELLKLCRAAENSQWAIGDQLITDCGAPSADGTNDGSAAKLIAASTYLTENGIEYAVFTLRQMRAVAHAFMPVTRVTGISYTCHKAAGNPERLQAIISGLPPGAAPTAALVRRTLGRFEADALREREKVQERIDAAQRELRTAITPSAKKIAKAKLDKITEEKGKLPPKRRAPVDPKKVPEVISSMKLWDMVGNAHKALRKAKKEATEITDDLTEVSIGAIVEECLMVADLAREISDIAKKNSKTRGTHLHVVTR